MIQWIFSHLKVQKKIDETAAQAAAKAYKSLPPYPMATVYTGCVCVLTILLSRKQMAQLICAVER